MGFLRSCLIVAVLKAVGNRPELREVLIRVVRKGRMSPEMSWRREDGIGSREQVVAWLDVTSLLTSSEERGAKQVRLAGVGEGGGRMAAGVKGGNVLQLLSWYMQEF